MPALSKFCIRGGCTKKPINETRLGCMTGRQEMMDAVRVEREKDREKKKRRKEKIKGRGLQKTRGGGNGQEKDHDPKLLRYKRLLLNRDVIELKVHRLIPICEWIILIFFLTFVIRRVPWPLGHRRHSRLGIRRWSRRRRGSRRAAAADTEPSDIRRWARGRRGIRLASSKLSHWNGCVRATAQTNTKARKSNVILR